jgi:hypothetical protein
MAVKLYDTIKKIPLSVWIAIHDSNDLTGLIIKGKPTDAELLMQWFILSDEFIEHFGLPDDFTDLLETKRQACIKLAQYCQNLDRFTEFEANVLLKETTNEANKVTDFSIVDEKGYIEESMGFWLDPERITVYEYYKKKKQAERKWRTQSKTTT